MSENEYGATFISQLQTGRRADGFDSNTNDGAPEVQMVEGDVFQEKGILYSINKSGSKIQVQRKSVLENFEEVEEYEPRPEKDFYKSRRCCKYDNVDSAGEDTDEEDKDLSKSKTQSIGAIEYQDTKGKVTSIPAN